MKPLSFLLGAAIAAFLVQPSGLVSASVIPASVSVGAGLTPDLDPRGESMTFTPALAATWSLSPRLAIKSFGGYFPDRIRPEGRTTIIPLGVGLRAYPGGIARSAPGLFLDAAPVAYISRVESYIYPDWNTVRWGYQAGVGARFSVLGSARGEIGMVVYHIDGTNGRADADSRPSGGHTFEGREIFTLCVSMGLGD